MKKKGINPMIIGAVLCAVLAVGAVYYMMQQADQRRQDELREMKKQMEAAIKDAKGGSAEVKINTSIKTHPIIMAREEIAANTRIDPILVKVEQVPEDLFNNAFSEKTEVDGKIARRRIAPGEPLTPDNVAKEFQKMSVRITPGMRAVALPVISRSNNTGGFATDGDRVDLFLTMDLKDAYTGKDLEHNLTKMVMQNVKILYIPGAEQFRTEKTAGVQPVGSPEITVTTTFEVTPEQAEILILFSHRGKINMVLRHKDDNVEVRTTGANSMEISEDPNIVQRIVNRSYDKVEETKQEIEDNKENSAPSDNNPASPPSNETILQP